MPRTRETLRDVGNLVSEATLSQALFRKTNQINKEQQ
jgi:hypothetical protein